MKANSLEELVTNSNIAGELRNYTDWHDRLVRFAQMVADWQQEQKCHGCFNRDEVFMRGMKYAKEQMIKDAFMDNYVIHDGRIELEGDPLPSIDPILILPYPQFKPGDKVRVVVLKAEEE